MQQEGENMKDIKLLYLCDRKACSNCSKECKHTSNIEHAINRSNLDGRLFEYMQGDEEILLFEKVDESQIPIFFEKISY